MEGPRSLPRHQRASGTGTNDSPPSSSRYGAYPPAGGEKKEERSGLFDRGCGLETLERFHQYIRSLRVARMARAAPMAREKGDCLRGCRPRSVNPRLPHWAHTMPNACSRASRAAPGVVLADPPPVSVPGHSCDGQGDRQRSHGTLIASGTLALHRRITCPDCYLHDAADNDASGGR